MSGNTGLYVAVIIIVAMIVMLVAQRTARKDAEASLRRRLAAEQRAVDANQQQTTDILDRLPVGIVALQGGTRRTIFTNKAADDIVMGRHSDHLPLIDENGSPVASKEHPFGGRPVPSEGAMYALVDGSGTTRHLFFSSMVVDDGEGGSEIIHMIRDDTARVESERAVERSHRLEALGTLTSGVAHDFSNLLTPILGGLDIASRDEGLSERSRKAIERATHATGSATALVDRLKSFSRIQDLEARPVGLRDLVDGAYELFGRKLGPNVSTQVRVHANPTVEVDPSQFELAMLNLMNNARDAFEVGGSLIITIDEQDVADGRHGLADGRYALLSVVDDGRGMDAETLARAVEPFFTTKEMGKASGLGLSMVDGFAAQSGGAFAIDSGPGEGTRVNIWLPASSTTAEAVTGGKPAVEPPVAPIKILLVDDEEMVRSATADMLADMGHTVVQASSGQAAIATVHRDKDIDAIISDHLMPGMTGGMMAHEIWHSAPNMPVLLVSGYAKTRGMPTDIPHLAKPFRRADLANAIASLMEERQRQR